MRCWKGEGETAGEEEDVDGGRQESCERDSHRAHSPAWFASDQNVSPESCFLRHHDQVEQKRNWRGKRTRGSKMTDRSGIACRESWRVHEVNVSYSPQMNMPCERSMSVAAVAAGLLAYRSEQEGHASGILLQHTADAVKCCSQGHRAVCHPWCTLAHWWDRLLKSSQRVDLLISFLTHFDSTCTWEIKRIDFGKGSSSSVSMIRKILVLV